jgi:hypothetical protein
MFLNKGVIIFFFLSDFEDIDKLLFFFSHQSIKLNIKMKAILNDVLNRTIIQFRRKAWGLIVRCWVERYRGLRLAV